MGWTAFGLVTAYTLALSVFAGLNPGWKPHRVETAWILFAFAFLVGLLSTFAVRGRPREGASPPWTSRDGWSLALVMALAVAVYSPALAVGFLSDDFVLLELGNLGAGWRQGSSHLLRVLPVWLLQAIDGLGPAWSPILVHLVSLSLHVANGALVYAIGRRLQLDPRASVLAAALFLLFPASPEAVVWASGLQDVLMAAASLGFVLATLEARHPALMVGCLVAGLLSKETAVVMPLLAATALWARGTRPTATVVRTLLACTLMAVAFGVWRLQAGAGSFVVAPTRYLLKEMLATAFGTLALPWTTDELSAAPLLAIVMASVVALAAWLVARAATRSTPRVAAFGIAWAILCIAPVYSLFFVSGTLEGSRYLYLPSAGWAVLLATASSAATPWFGRPMRWTLYAMAALWAAGTYGHVGPWRRAAMERDRVLATAATAPVPGCATVAFVDAPDTVSGAYVFRNGLAAALRRAGTPSVVDDAEAATCVFAWNGERFVRSR